MVEEQESGEYMCTLYSGNYLYYNTIYSLFYNTVYYLYYNTVYYLYYNTI